MIPKRDTKEHLRYIRNDLFFLEGFINNLPLENAARAITRIDGIRGNLNEVEKAIELSKKESTCNT